MVAEKYNSHGKKIFCNMNKKISFCRDSNPHPEEKKRFQYKRSTDRAKSPNVDMSVNSTCLINFLKVCATQISICNLI